MPLPPRDSKMETIGRNIVNMNPEEVDSQWKRHCDVVHSLLNKREKINDLMANFMTSNSDDCKSFESYWQKNCKMQAEFSLYFFYFGTTLMYIATTLFMLQQYTFTYLSMEGAYVSIVLMMSSLVLGLSLAGYLRYQFIRGIKRE